MIQAVIARLGTDSFLVKGWGVTISGVFLGFAVGNKHGILALASVIPVLLFWVLDAYFLRAERLFRTLYEYVRSSTSNVEPFFMGATSPAFTSRLSSTEKAGASRPRTFFSVTLVLFYGVLILSAVVVAVAT